MIDRFGDGMEKIVKENGEKLDVRDVIAKLSSAFEAKDYLAIRESVYTEAVDLIQYLEGLIANPEVSDDVRKYCDKALTELKKMKEIYEPLLPEMREWAEANEQHNWTKKGEIDSKFYNRSRYATPENRALYQLNYSKNALDVLKVALSYEVLDTTNLPSKEDSIKELENYDSFERKDNDLSLDGPETAVFNMFRKNKESILEKIDEELSKPIAKKEETIKSEELAMMLDEPRIVEEEKTDSMTY